MSVQHKGTLDLRIERLTAKGDEMAQKLRSLAQTLRERGYDDAPYIEALVKEWEEAKS